MLPIASNSSRVQPPDVVLTCFSLQIHVLHALVSPVCHRGSLARPTPSYPVH